jgi:hypothetical protein
MPILVQGAHMPTAGQLPLEIRGLGLSQRLRAQSHPVGVGHSGNDEAAGSRRFQTGRRGQAIGFSRRRIPCIYRDDSAASRAAAAGSEAANEPYTRAGVGDRCARYRRDRCRCRRAVRTQVAVKAVVTDDRFRHCDSGCARGPKPARKIYRQAFHRRARCWTGLDMVLISGGSFTMGSPADEPERQANEGPHTMSRLLHSL